METMHVKKTIDAARLTSGPAGATGDNSDVVGEIPGSESDELCQTIRQGLEVWIARGLPDTTRLRVLEETIGREEKRPFERSGHGSGERHGGRRATSEKRLAHLALGEIQGVGAGTSHASQSPTLAPRIPADVMVT